MFADIERLLLGLATLSPKWFSPYGDFEPGEDAKTTFDDDSAGSAFLREWFRLCHWTHVEVASEEHAEEWHARGLYFERLDEFPTILVVSGWNSNFSVDVQKDGAIHVSDWQSGALVPMAHPLETILDWTLFSLQHSRLCHFEVFPMWPMDEWIPNTVEEETAWSGIPNALACEYAYYGLDFDRLEREFLDPSNYDPDLRVDPERLRPCLELFREWQATSEFPVTLL